MIRRNALHKFKNFDREKASNAFHDGVNLLRDVSDWHRIIRMNLKENDTVTGRVLDMVDKRMLLANPQERAPARIILAELQKIISSSAKNHPKGSLIISLHESQDNDNSHATEGGTGQDFTTSSKVHEGYRIESPLPAGPTRSLMTFSKISEVHPRTPEYIVTPSAISIRGASQRIGLDISVAPSLFMVPFRRDEKFVGRKDTLAEIDKMHQHSTLQSHPRLALIGLGGVG